MSPNRATVDLNGEPVVGRHCNLLLISHPDVSQQTCVLSRANGFASSPDKYLDFQLSLSHHFSSGCASLPVLSGALLLHFTNRPSLYQLMRPIPVHQTTSLSHDSDSSCSGVMWHKCSTTMATYYAIKPLKLALKHTYMLLNV